MVFISGTALHAQNAHDAQIRFLKDDRPGMVAEYPYAERLVSAALKARLTVLGKSKTQKATLKTSLAHRLPFCVLNFEILVFRCALVAELEYATVSETVPRMGLQVRILPRAIRRLIH